MEWISITGWALSLIGTCVAIYQIHKTKKISAAARDASLLTSTTLQRNLAILSMSSCVSEIEEIKALIRGARYESALIRVSDLIGKLAQFKTMPKASNISEIPSMQEIFVQLSILRERLELKLHKPNSSLNAPDVNRALSAAADAIHEWIGLHKFLENGVSNDK